jgi:hypothetical protein
VKTFAFLFLKRPTCSGQGSREMMTDTPSCANATSPGPSAVLMATANAIGRWLHEYPVTPDRVLKDLGKIPPAKKGAAR